MSLLHDPHHDGSPLYVSDEAPELGATVTVRVRTERDRPGRGGLAADDVRRRAGLPPDDVDHRRGDVVWWEGELPVHNPVTHYRFLLVAPSPTGRASRSG